MLAPLPDSRPERPLAAPAPDRLVHFAGLWTDRERELLHAALRRAERSFASVPAFPRDAGTLWVCCRQPYGTGKTIFTATRLGHPSVLVATSFDGLVEQVLRGREDADG